MKRKIKIGNILIILSFAMAFISFLMMFATRFENIDDYKNWAYMLVISFVNLVFLLALKESKWRKIQKFK